MTALAVDRRLTGAIRFAAGLVTLILLWLVTEPGLIPGMPFNRLSNAVYGILVALSFVLSYLVVRGALQLFSGREIGPWLTPSPASVDPK